MAFVGQGLCAFGGISGKWKPVSVYHLHISDDMKSNKQKRLELEAKRKRQDNKLVQKLAAALEARLARERVGHVTVNREKLAPNSSYDTPEFVSRGYYVDQPFTCIDCGKSEVWTETQQQWWYEVAKRSVQTTARRCRTCRRRERERRNEAQRVQREGLMRKQQSGLKMGQLPKAERKRRKFIADNR